MASCRKIDTFNLKYPDFDCANGNSDTGNFVDMGTFCDGKTCPGPDGTTYDSQQWYHTANGDSITGGKYYAAARFPKACQSSNYNADLFLNNRNPECRWGPSKPGADEV